MHVQPDVREARGELARPLVHQVVEDAGDFPLCLELALIASGHARSLIR